jgi:S1-C subfamily serine protease
VILTTMWRLFARRTLAVGVGALVMGTSVACGSTPQAAPLDPRVQLTVPTREPTATTAPAIAGSPTSAPTAAPAATVAPQPTASLAPLSEQDAIARVLPAVVRVSHLGAVGTGIIVAPDGLIVTNAHVVGDAQTVDIQFQDGHTSVGTVQRADTWADLAAVRVGDGGLPTVALGDSSQLQLWSALGPEEPDY